MKNEQRRPHVEYLGTTIGRLTILSFVRSGVKKNAMCLCECGSRVAVLLESILRGNTKSCGCYQKECVVKRFTKHGACNTPLYKRWRYMMTRCTNPKRVQWKDYGGRGIQVCKRWQKFENFAADMGKPPTPNHSLDRINNDSDYKPSNCRWATQKEQRRNTRRALFIDTPAGTMFVAEAAEKYGVSRKTLARRAAKGQVGSYAVRPSRESTVMQ